MMFLVPVQPILTLALNRKHDDQYRLKSEDETETGIVLQHKYKATIKNSNDKNKCLITYYTGDSSTFVIKNVTDVEENQVKTKVINLNNRITIREHFDREKYFGMLQTNKVMTSQNQAELISKS